MIPIFVGYDERESAAYHVFCQSVIDTASVPVQFIPLHGPMLEGFDGQQDGTNRFIYSRFLVPELMDYQGWAIFADGDMLCQRDIAELWALRGDDVALMVAHHQYESTHEKKFIGSPMEATNLNYPRKNQSSLILWNCGHPANRILTRKLVAEAGGKFLHRFEWLNDDQIGWLQIGWNWLVGEYPENQAAPLLHYTLGIPGFENYVDCDSSRNWHNTLLRTLNVIGEQPVSMVRRSVNRQYRILRIYDGSHNELRDPDDSGAGLSSAG